MEKEVPEVKMIYLINYKRWKAFSN